MVKAENDIKRIFIIQASTRTSQNNEAHLFLQKQCMIQHQKETDLDLPIKIYTFLLNSIGYLKKMTRDVNHFLLLLFLHILEPHIILINNSYKIMQKVQECLVNKQSVFSKKTFYNMQFLRQHPPYKERESFLLIKKSSAANRLRKPGFFH